MKICFATNNRNKLEEIAKMLGKNFDLVSLASIGCTEDIPEEQDTIEGNSLQKAEYVKEHYQVNCFADDTGLEVEALDGAPGVYSARYAGPDANNERNMDLLLQRLEGHENRNARFKTVITLIIDATTVQFEGIVNGTIAKERSGLKGFGYDPIFVPEGMGVSFAAMSMEEKNTISHRSKAVQKLINYLQNAK